MLFGDADVEHDGPLIVQSSPWPLTRGALKQHAAQTEKKQTNLAVSLCTYVILRLLTSKHLMPLHGLPFRL